MKINKLFKPLNKLMAKMGYGREIVYLPGDRRPDHESHDMSMEKIDAIMSAAKSGEPARLYQYAEEIFDKNFDIKQAMSTRQAAFSRTPWNIEPASKSAFDVQVAKDLKIQLDKAGAGSDELMSFNEMLSGLSFGLYTGLAVNEIVWSMGGDIEGFQPIIGRSLTFRDNVYRPKLNTGAGLMDLSADKYIVQSVRGVSGIPAHGGLIFTLAYLHCFQNMNVKYLLRFVERYGMPFTVAKVDEKTWETEREAIKQMITDFGPDGGGIFTRGTELALLQAANNSGEVYFKILEFFSAAITKVILGQLASSSDSSGLSGGDAQSKVRQDIRESDCVIMETTINTKFIPLWVKFNYGEHAKCPLFKMQYKPAEDLAKRADLLSKLYTAGLESDPAEQSAIFGMKLTRKAVPVPQPASGLALSDEPAGSARMQLMSGAESLPGNALSKFAGDADKWAGKFAKTVAKLAEKGTPEEILSFSSKAVQSTNGAGLDKLFNTEVLAEAIEKTVYAGVVAGTADRIDALKRKAKTGKTK